MQSNFSGGGGGENPMSACGKQQGQRELVRLKSNLPMLNLVKIEHNQWINL